MDTGKVDAIFVVEPFLAAAKAKGWKQIGAYADVDPKLCVALYFTSQALAASNPDLVKRFAEAMKESLEYADCPPGRGTGDPQQLHADHRGCPQRAGPAEVAHRDRHCLDHQAR